MLRQPDRRIRGHDRRAERGDLVLNETKKQYKKLLPLIRQANPQALHDDLRGMQIFAKSLTVYSAMLAATVERNVQTIARLAGGGDLLDLLEEVLPDEDDGEENDNGNE